MKGFTPMTLRSGILLVFSLIAVQLENADASYTMNETCSYYGNGYIGNPTNCQGWGLCQNGVLLGTGQCNAGFLYEVTTGMCNYASSVTCTTSVANICSTLSAPQIIMDPNNCNSYCYCSSTIAAQCGNCPTNQIFNQATQACIWNTQDSCAANSVCRLVPNNKFVANPNVCGGYLRCEAGSGIAGTCAVGYGYDALTGYCQTGVSCSGGALGVGSNLPPNATACGPASTATVAAPAYVSDGQTCFGYYMCTSTTGPGTWGKCPFATHFDPTTPPGACVTPYEYACPYNRCGNLNLPFVTAISTLCADYVVCNNQTTTSTPQPCSNVNPAFPDFDEVSGTCVTTAPTYPICT